MKRLILFGFVLVCLAVDHAQATPTFVAVSSGAPGGTTIAVRRPIGTSVGDVIYAVIGFSDGTPTETITGPGAGWTIEGTAQTTGTQKGELWYLVVTDATVSWNFTLSGSPSGSSGFVAASYSGVDSGDPIEVVAKTGNTGDTSIVAASVVTGFANEMVDLMMLAQANFLTCTTAASNNERLDATNGGCIDDRVFASAGATGTQTITAGSSVDSVIFTVGLRSTGDSGNKCGGSFCGIIGDQL